MKKLTPERAIRKYCLRCSCGDKKEVELCCIPDCPLYAFRMGESESVDASKMTVGDIFEEKTTNVPSKADVKEEVDKIKEEIKEDIKQEPVDEEKEISIVEEPKIEENPVKKPRKKKTVETKQEHAVIETSVEHKDETPVDENDNLDLNDIDIDDLFD